MRIFLKIPPFPASSYLVYLLPVIALFAGSCDSNSDGEVQRRNTGWPDYSYQSKHLEKGPSDSRFRDVEDRGIPPEPLAEQTYEPPFALPKPPRSDKIYSFQLIQEAKMGPVLKIDTADVRNQHTLELYQYNKRYKIFHVPGFATRRRLINEKDEPAPKRAIRRTEYLGYDYDWYLLSEFNDYDQREIALRWGMLKAGPETEILPFQQLRENLDGPLRLSVDGEALKIKGFHVLTVGREHEPALFMTLGLEQQDLRKAILRLPPASSVYFDKIIIEDKQGNDLIFPLSFAFHFGEKISRPD